MGGGIGGGKSSIEEEKRPKEGDQETASTLLTSASEILQCLRENDQDASALFGNLFLNSRLAEELCEMNSSNRDFAMLKIQSGMLQPQQTQYSMAFCEF